MYWTKTEIHTLHMPRPRRNRAFCLTWNDGDTTRAYKLNILNTVACDYIIYQEEIGENGNHHFQGYVYFPNGKTLERVRAIFPGCNIEVARRSPKINKEYCSKLDTRAPGGAAAERGVLPDQGHRADLEEFVREIEAGKSDFEMMHLNASLWCRYRIALIAHR
ncbi:replication protein, partial [uncultured marine virus]